jgi:hypothetical protein
MDYWQNSSRDQSILQQTHSSTDLHRSLRSIRWVAHEFPQPGPQEVGSRHWDPFCQSDETDYPKENRSECRTYLEIQSVISNCAGEGKSSRLGKKDQSISGIDQSSVRFSCQKNLTFEDTLEKKKLAKDGKNTSRYHSPTLEDARWHIVPSSSRGGQTLPRTAHWRLPTLFSCIGTHCESNNHCRLTSTQHSSNSWK